MFRQRYTEFTAVYVQRRAGASVVVLDRGMYQGRHRYAIKLYAFDRLRHSFDYVTSRMLFFGDSKISLID